MRQPANALSKVLLRKQYRAVRHLYVQARALCHGPADYLKPQSIFIQYHSTSQSRFGRYSNSKQGFSPVASLTTTFFGIRRVSTFTSNCKTSDSESNRSDRSDKRYFDRSKMWTLDRVPPSPQELLDTNQKWVADTDPELFVSSAKGQKPSVFWLGCCDSRVPAELVTGAAPGDLFVHRNIANTFSHGDGSAMAALAYAVNHLGVSHIVVCGHYGCGGVMAAMESAQQHQATLLETDEGSAAIQRWLNPIRELAVTENQKMKEKGSQNISLRSLVEKNVGVQVKNVADCSIIKKAWEAGKNVTLHGWVYDIATGKIDDLKMGGGNKTA